MFPKLLAVGFLAGGSQASWVQQEPHVLAYSGDRSSWVVHEKVPQEYSVELTVALRVDTDRHAELERVFWEVSDPKHKNYGNHLSIDEITKILAIPDSRVGLVTSYFEQAGATTVIAPIETSSR